MTPARSPRAVRMAFFVVGLAGLLVACGGDPALDGFGDGDTPGGSGGGIGGSGVIAQDQSIGTIDGFGSILLNGHRLDVASASVHINGRDGGIDELAVGMRVRADVDFVTLTASRVEYVATLSGTVDSLDTAASQLMILGRQVRLVPSTLYDGLTKESLTIGQSLEISGYENATGAVFATLIRPAAEPNIALYSGLVDAADVTGGQLSVAGQTFGTSDADLSAFVHGFPQVGQRVLVYLSNATSATGTDGLSANRIIPADASTPTTGSRLELAGVVTGFTNVASFSVNGRAVSTTTSTEVELANGIPIELARIGLNTRVEVEGVVDENGELIANRIIVTPSENSELLGLIDRVDSENGNLVVLGVTVHVSSTTRFKSDDDRALSLNTLVAGDYVDIKAAYEGSQLLALLVEREEVDSEAQLQGPVTAVDRIGGTLDVLGQTIVPGPDTEFELDNDNETTMSHFLDNLSIGDVIEVTWDAFSDLRQPPDSIERELPSD